MPTRFRFTLLLVSLCLAWGGANVQAAAGAASPTGKHPEITEQEKLTDCAECHQQATPGVYKQWFDSSHGIGMVKCYQCHGTYENFKTTPAISDCAVCHVNMVNKCPKDKPCWACHTPHSFKRADK
jgi:hypothetical protein